MKVVEEKRFEHEFTCKGCGSKLIAEADDIRYGDFGAGYGGDTDWQYYARCPVCGECYFIKSALLPPNVVSRARRNAGRR